MNLRQAAFSIGRGIGKHPTASYLFCWTERLLPVQRLGRSETCVALVHPRPSWNPHYLVVPTTPFPSLTTVKLSEARKSRLVWEIVVLARTVATAENATIDWQLVINGGERQDIGQVHGHLIHADNSRSGEQVILNDPAHGDEGWNGIWQGLNIAQSTPKNGYSLVFSGIPAGPVTASISQALN